MGNTSPSTRPARSIASTLALTLLGSFLTVVAIVAPAQSAQAATVTIGTIQGQMANHRGADNGTGGDNCITYHPTGTSTSSALVASPNEAQTGHGSDDGRCPPQLSTSEQSVVGFRPSPVTSAQDGASFLMGRMIHYNNPIQASDRYFTGAINTVLAGFTAPNTLSFPWNLDETPNIGGGVNDVLTFTNQISTVTLTQGGLSFRLVVLGFVPVASGSTCPANPSGTPVNQFSTVEGQQTHACLYSALEQVRRLTVTKVVSGAAPARTFGFTSNSSLAGSPWSNGGWNLSGGGSETRDIVSGNTVTVTENDPNDDRWELTGLTCKQYAADATTLVDVPGATLNPAARQAVLNNVPAPLSITRPEIICTYTNAYTPKATLTLVKQVQSGSASPTLFTLTATGSAAPPPAERTISGPSGSVAVTTQRLPAGTYALTDVGTGAAATGYVQVGDWVCRTTGGATVAVANGNVTLADSAAATTSADVTCTVTNRLSTGSLRISKAVDAPPGAFTGGSAKTFSGSYDCGTGYTGTFTTLTTASPVVIAGIATGRTCTVTEDAPSGGLANASYSWTEPVFTSQPVTVEDNATAVVTITNPVVQKLGALSVTKTISGPPDGGYTGGTNRVFPVQYTCALTDGPTTAGTLPVTLAEAATRTDIPAGSVCSFSETLTIQDGDFADPSLVWEGYAVSPQTVTIGDNATVEVTVTNTFKREIGSLVVAKVVQGGGYTGGTGQNFVVNYECGPSHAGQVQVAAGASVTIADLPARNTCSVQEVAPDPALLSPAYIWGTPTWSPGPTATIVAGGSTTLTVTNPTVPVFGQISVTKAIAGAVEGVPASIRFEVRVDCGATFDSTFSLGAGANGTTPNLPVGTTCTVTETLPVDPLVDASYAWAPGPAPQQATITEAGQVVPVTLTNTVVRVSGQLQITKVVTAPAGVVDPTRTYAIDYTCRYGGEAAVQGTVTLAAGGSATVPDLLLTSLCVVTEQTGSLDAPPAVDPSWLWLPPTYAPSEQVVVSSATAPAAVTVTNSVQQLTGSFLLSKVVSGAGKEGGYPPGATFTFGITCTNGLNETVVLADGQSWEAPDLPTFTQCTVAETGKPDPGPAYEWEPAEFTVNGVASGANQSVTFPIPDQPLGVQVQAGNTIIPVLSSVAVTKTVTGETTGLAGAAPPFNVTLICGIGHTHTLSVPAGGSATASGIPVGSTCTAVESSPSGGLVDESYTWADPIYTPESVTVIRDQTVSIGISNPIVRVTAPVTLVKSFIGPQGVVDPDRTYPITWSCTYGGTEVVGGQLDLAADPDGIVVAQSVPLTSVCTATEGDLGPPSVDPAFRWLDPTITGTTVALPGPNTVTVANTLTRDSGTVLVRKQVIGETAGYIGTGEAFTLHGNCRVPGQPEIPTRYADGAIADGGEVPITASIGWTCSGYEDTPSQSLLRDESYAWGPPTLDPEGEFVLTRAAPTRIFLAQNPVVRVGSALTIVKDVVDPDGILDPSATFTGSYSCQYGSDAPVTGTWSITPATSNAVTVDNLLLTSVCTVTEDDPGTTGLPDPSYAWGPPTISGPATVVSGETATVTVTNTVQRLYAGLQLTKTLDDPAGGVPPGAQFVGVWTCALGGTEYSDRFTVGANSTAVLFAPSDQRVPATALCSVTEDTPDPATLFDGSFAWDTPVLSPPDVVLVTGETATLGLANTVIRVYSDVTTQKVVTGPAEPLVDPSRRFTGFISCQYRSEPPIVTTWAATIETPDLRPGVLVESVCTVIEDDPGLTGQPVAADPSYVWMEQVVSGPVTVPPPEVATPPIVVTNPTERLFGTFTVLKTVSGATDGIVDPGQPFPMAFSCQPGVGPPIDGELDVVVSQVFTVGPTEQIPVSSECTLTEPADGLPPLRDSAWSWNDPTFTVDGIPVAATARTVTFTIPSPQEDVPEPLVAIGVDNSITKTPGAFNMTKSGDPPSGTEVQPGATISYTVTVDSTGSVPVHDLVVTDDLSGVLANATLVDASVTAPDGSTATVDGAAQRLVWTIGTVPNGEQSSLRYQVVVDADASGVSLTNLVTSAGSENCDPARVAAGPRRTMVQAPAASCSTTNTTPQQPVSPPVDPPVDPSVEPGTLPGTGFPLAMLLWWTALCLGVGVLVLFLARRGRPVAARSAGRPPAGSPGSAR